MAGSKIKLAMALLVVPIAGAMLLAGCAREEAAPAYYEADGIAFNFPVT